jgi:spoIIIJ-associated protein
MRSIESEGDSIDQAIDNALRALQIARDRVEIEILENASRGLFGFGGKKARVRATVRAPLGAAIRGEDSVDSQAPSQAPAIVSREASRERRSTDEAPAESGAAAAPNTGHLEVRSRAILGEILEHLGVACRVQASAKGERGQIVLEITGDSSGLLIGRRGQTLDAIQYIVNLIVGRDDDAGGARVVLDVEGYRERRREYLEALARRLADKAKESGRVVTLNPMSPRDRRIVHLTLQDDRAIATRSHGQGYYRKILILPAEKGRRTPRPADHAE